MKSKLLAYVFVIFVRYRQIFKNISLAVICVKPMIKVSAHSKCVATLPRDVINVRFWYSFTRRRSEATCGAIL